jgi:hypothetical protein
MRCPCGWKNDGGSCKEAEQMGLISGINIDVGSVLGQAGKFFKDIRAAITGKEILDPTKLAELEARAQELEANMMNAQMEINKVEAAHSSIFIAGWRPFIGWICGVGLLYHYVGFSLVQWYISFAKAEIVAPKLDTEGLLSIVFALLGLGTLRTWEKVKGAEGNR